MPKRPHPHFHREEMLRRRIRQSARQTNPLNLNTPNIKYTGAWLRNIRREKGIGRSIKATN